MSFLKTMINSVARTFGRILAYALIGIAIYFIASKVHASPQYRVSTGSWGEWTNVNVDTDYSFATSVGTSWSSYIQLKDTVAFENNKTYNLNANLEVVLRESGTRDMNSALDSYIYNGSTLTKQSDKCTITGTRSDKTSTVSSLTYTTHTYKVNVNCVGLNGQGYYPYLTLRFLSDSSQATTFTFNIKSWEYHVGSDSTDANNIMNNANQNTQQIIENYNQNTQEIIQNNIDLANNLVETIENQNKVCNAYDLMFTYNDRNNYDLGFINNNGTISSVASNWYYTSQFYNITKDKTITLGGNALLSSNASYCIYDKDYSIIECHKYSEASQPYTITPTQDGFLRFSMFLSGTSYSAYLRGLYCFNALEKETEQNEEINNNLKEFLTIFSDDSTPSDSEINSTLNGINLPSDTPMTNLLMFPIVVFSFFSNSMSSSCSPISLGTLYGHELSLPCLNVANYLGLTLWNIIDLLAMFYMIYNIAHLLIGIFEDISELRSPFLRFFIKNRGVIND